jgi:hypothetical protein
MPPTEDFQGQMRCLLTKLFCTGREKERERFSIFFHALIMHYFQFRTMIISLQTGVAKQMFFNLQKKKKNKVRSIQNIKQG